MPGGLGSFLLFRQNLRVSRTVVGAERISIRSPHIVVPSFVEPTVITSVDINTNTFTLPLTPTVVGVHSEFPIIKV